jgi:hypothetical protein
MMMRRLGVAIFTISIAGPAAAQDRGFVQGIAGVTFGTEASSVIAGGVVIPVTPRFHIVGEIGRLQNIASKAVREDAERVEHAIEDAFPPGEEFDIVSDVTSPAFYAMAGGRVVAPSGRVRPFVGARAGFARVSPDIRLSFALDGSDVTEQAIDAGFLTADSTASTTSVLTGVGGGVTLDAGPSVSVEIGYTWLRVFSDPATNLSRAYAAIGFRF